MQQQIYYSQVLLDKKRLFPHKCIDLVEMQLLKCFEPVLNTFNSMGLMNVVNFHQDWNEELVLQFYATLFIFVDPKDSTTWVLDWMMQDTHCKYSATEFMSHFNFRRPENKEEEQSLHMQDTVNPK